ncbi:riboflavin synthase [Isoptericola variabilis]|uniref:Riboflavin synthase n=1 Tax=Isoptericola variabilis (strain 225) TaxID=743718 RepID=F6FUE0_ISOV2|nr:riboflavin synthase [Isoptericola variabilis]AEG44268.1 riboflavin synthase, alpha subunit [Isoptericola variabilis 225]TWH28412.1 riboflavin synthase alpha chain [Isoptericola variabilis J7]
MFTGIVEELGTVVALTESADAARLEVGADEVLTDARHGDSIAVNGCCLTVAALGTTAGGRRTWTADLMAETLERTTLGGLVPGAPVNLERALAAGGRLGGHVVQGHVDGVGTVLRREPGERWDVVEISLPADLARYVVAKGSIAVDGVSLTVVDAGDDRFTVSLIPETLARTTLGTRAVGEQVNLETDVLARHVERLLAAGVAR